jgi:signal transduction histidine kinase
VDEALSVLREIVREPPSERSPGIAGAYHDICAVLQETGREDDLRDCALEFRAGLAEGRWDLEKALYEYYSGRVRGWLATSDGAGESPLARQESARLDLTAIAAAALSAWRTAGEEREGHLLLAKPGAATVVAWQREGNDGAALQVLTQAAVRREVLQPLAARLAPDHIVSIWANQAPVLAGSPPKQSPAPRSLHDAPSAMVLVADRTVVWRVTASPLPGTSESGLGMRGGTTLAAVGLMLLSAALAGFFAVRSVRQELEVARLKSEFVSTVSHELRSPLAAISHLSELLDGGRVTDETRKREYYRLIVAETARLRRLVENLLNFARLEEGRQEFRFQPLEAGAWLQATVDAFRDGPAADGREIVLDIAPDLPPVRADAAALGTVVVNLLDNAVKYSPSGTAIRVLLDGADDRIELRVADEGPGIDDADRARVFERFYRGRNAQGVAGTGLGLALVQRIVLAHGGTTRVERGERGTGTAFTVSLPSAEDTTGSARAPVEERR